MTEPASPPPTPTAPAPASDAPRHPERFEPVAGLLALLVPGAGHWYLGERRRALCIAAGILGLFVGGLLIGGLDAVDSREDRVWFFAQALVGPAAFAADAAHQALKPGAGETPGPGHVARSLGRMNEIATLYVAIAGMLNLIAVLDALFHRSPTPA